MLAAVDLVTGQIGRVVRGTGATIRIGDPHPDTGHPIAGTVLPDWPALRHLVERAAGVLPGIGQSWDVPLTEHGPVLLEVNFGGRQTWSSSRMARACSAAPTRRICAAIAMDQQDALIRT